MLDATGLPRGSAVTCNIVDISDIELELIIFIRVKIIIHVYNFSKKYVVTVKNRMEVVNSKHRW